MKTEQLIEVPDFGRLVYSALRKSGKKLPYGDIESIDDLINRVKFSIWKNLRGRELDLSHTTIIFKHTFFVLGIAGENIKKQMRVPTIPLLHDIKSKKSQPVTTSIDTDKYLSILTSRQRDILLACLRGEKISDMTSRFGVSKTIIYKIRDFSLKRLRRRFNETSNSSRRI